MFVKVKAASILPIEKSGIDDSAFRFALQSEFDFVVTDDDLRPLFAVEFHGNTHETEVQRQRDRKKNQLLTRPWDRIQFVAGDFGLWRGARRGA